MMKSRGLVQVVANMHEASNSRNVHEISDTSVCLLEEALHQGSSHIRSQITLIGSILNSPILLNVLSWINSEVNKQLGDQLKCYDARTENKLSLLADYHEFYKRLGEVDLEYARNLEKVAERFQDRLRQKSQR